MFRGGGPICANRGPLFGQFGPADSTVWTLGSGPEMTARSVQQTGFPAPLRPFQRKFVRAALRPDVDTAVFSLPRANGKSWLAARILTRALTPGDALHVPGSEYLQCAASLEQARVVFRFIREALEPTGDYTWSDSHQRIGAVHRASNTRLRVLSSNGKTAMGIVGTPLLVADEPGSWEVKGGELMHDAIQTAIGKPGSPLKTIYIGTLAPSKGGWWPELVAEGSHGSTYVQALQGDADRWDQWPEIRRVNPLVNIDAKMRRRLLEERDRARLDPAKKAQFLSYRLNVPTGDESTVLLTVADWDAVVARPVAAREGRPVLALDLGGGRAWSAAVAIWPSGRAEAWAVTGGIPSLEDQEKRDRVPKGTYQALHRSGRLHVAEGLRVPEPRQLIDLTRGIRPEVIVCDFFRLNELRDTRPPAPVVTRRMRWSEASEDIRALRKIALDGPLTVDPASSALIEASLAVTTVKSDDQGSMRLWKADGTRNTARDDVAAALTLAAGLWIRAGGERRRHSGLRYDVLG